MSDTAELHGLTMAVGELKGQLRELIHTSNNTAQKVDGMAQLVFASRDLPLIISELAKRVDSLETERDRRGGATSLGAAILKSPAFGWFVGIVGGLFAAIKGGLFK